MVQCVCRSVVLHIPYNCRGQDYRKTEVSQMKSLYLNCVCQLGCGVRIHMCEFTYTLASPELLMT